jgi:hypothetical protein
MFSAIFEKHLHTNANSEYWTATCQTSTNDLITTNALYAFNAGSKSPDAWN